MIHDAPEAEDEGFSLDALSAAYADAMGKKESPFTSREADQPQQVAEVKENKEEAIRELVDRENQQDNCELSPRTILEAMLFVGNPENAPLSAEEVASKMRGVQADEIDDLIAELNASYEVECCPYTIASSTHGYRMVLREEFSGLREKFYGKVREARLSQAAIDVLSLVAYNPGITRDQADELRGKPSGPLLNQLVRRQLIRLERTNDEHSKKTASFFTTERFLKLFRLNSLEDLPQAEGVEFDD